MISLRKERLLRLSRAVDASSSSRVLRYDDAAKRARWRFVFTDSPSSKYSIERFRMRGSAGATTEHRSSGTISRTSAMWGGSQKAAVV
eukprot:scaffold14533_cov118-Isochrysis_galbana.AAC.4